MSPIATVPKFTTSKAPFGAAVAIALSAALAIGFVSTYWRLPTSPPRAEALACDSPPVHPCRAG